MNDCVSGEVISIDNHVSNLHSLDFNSQQLHLIALLVKQNGIVKQIIQSPNKLSTVLKTSFIFLLFFLQCWQFTRKQPSNSSMCCRNALRSLCASALSSSCAQPLHWVSQALGAQMLLSPSIFLFFSQTPHLLMQENVQLLLMNAWFVLGCFHLCAVGMAAPGQWGHRALQSCPRLCRILSSWYSLTLLFCSILRRQNIWVPNYTLILFRQIISIEVSLKN